MTKTDRYRYILLVFFLAGCCFTSSAQVYLKMEVNGELPKVLNRKLPATKQRDSMTTAMELNRYLVACFDLGYLEATYSEYFRHNDTINVVLSTGKPYRWLRIKTDTASAQLIDEAGLRNQLFEGKAVSPGHINNFNTKLLTWYENNGHPFVSITYRDIVFEDEGISATLHIDPGTRITIDSVIVRGEARLSGVYLRKYLGIAHGDYYNESLIRKIPDRIRELPMVTESRPFNVAFAIETARVILYLEDKKASRIDGVIGVLPDNEKQGKVQLTGDLRIRLLSAFGRGELFDLNWKQPRAKTQDLKVNLNYPFLFSTPFGLDFKFSIYKFDTTYVETKLAPGIQFLLKQGSYFKAFLEDHNSSLLSTKQYENSTILPPFADIRKTMYGLGYKTLNLDYRLNPTRGYTLDISASVGNRVIRKNGRLRPELYDSLELKTLQYRGEMSFDFFVPLLPKVVLNPGLMSGGIGGSETFDNELYRLGGLSDLRGFDDESVTATFYAIAKAEVRYLLDINSYLLIFVNGAWYERRSQSGYLNDQPLGFGAGITFETKLGIFSLNYALGKEFSNQVKFRNSKIHFGLINYF